MVSTVSGLNYIRTHFWSTVTWRLEEDGQCFRNAGMEKLISTGIKYRKYVWKMITDTGADKAYRANMSVMSCSFRDWVDYRDGFGDFKLWNDEFWLGNENIYSLLSEGQQKLYRQSNAT